MWRVLPLTWISNLFQDLKIQFYLKSNLTSAISNFSKLGHLAGMFPTIMPWPMTIAPTNEAIRHKNCAEKTLIQKKVNRHDTGGHGRCKDSITIKEG
jgi:hypothetical protein